jgi:hypothetical protein
MASDDVTSERMPAGHVFDHVPDVTLPLFEVGAAVIALAAAACFLRRRTLRIGSGATVSGFVVQSGRDPCAQPPPSAPVLCVWRC